MCIAQTDPVAKTEEHILIARNTWFTDKAKWLDHFG